MPTADLALAVRKVTRQGSTRIAEVAFDLAKRRRRKVTAVHKGNVLRVSEGLFLECVRSVAAGFADIAYEEKIVDAMAALLVRDASAFDVIVTTNMFGDILSDEASEISGSLGLAESINAGTTHAIAQAQHGSAPDIAGKDIANPAALIGSAAMLLAWLWGTRRRKRKTLGGDGGTTGIKADFAAGGFDTLGAWFLGRNMSGPVRGPWPDDSWKGWWGDNPPYHVPVFVLTHHPRASFTMSGGTTFHFVTDGIDKALERAVDAAGGEDVRLGGGVATIRQYLSAGLIDEMHLAIAPVLLGAGENLLSGIDAP